MINSKVKKTLLILTSVILVIVIVTIAFISPISKYLIEKYDVKYTGREIKMDLLYVNPFTGNVYFRNLKILENKSDTVFFAATGLTVNFEMAKLLFKTYEISEVTLTEPIATVVQNKNIFNFTDLINKFAPDSTKPKEQKDTTPLHFNILDVNIINGTFYYDEKVTPVKYSIKKFNFKSPGKYWNKNLIHGELSFEAGVGKGALSSKFDLEVISLAYKATVLVKQYDLNILQQYLKDISTFGTLSALVDANLAASGNFNDAINLNAHGKISISDFQLAKTPGEDYASFSNLAIGIIKLNPQNKSYVFDTIALQKPYFKFEQYDYLNNIERMFGQNGAAVKKANDQPQKTNLILLLADYIKELSKNFFKSYYKVNRVAITDGHVVYNDYSLSEKFSIAVNPFSFLADSIDKNKTRVHANFKTGIQPHGNASIFLSMNPKDEGDFDMNFKLRNVAATMFNPYLVTFTSYPLDRGSIEMNANWNVRNANIQSNNHLLILDPRVTKKIKKEDTKWIPMPLIMGIVREQGNVIDYTIPITGNLNDPKFHLKDAIIDILKNIIIKPVTTPYRLEVKNIEKKVEKALTFTWKMRQTVLNPQQTKFLEKIAKFIKDYPEASIIVNQMAYEEKEKEYILLYESKKRYFLAKTNKKRKDFTEEDSVAVEKMSIKDKAFINYLNDNLKDSMIFTVQHKGKILISKDVINTIYHQLGKARRINFENVFKKDGLENRVKFKDSPNDIPFNGFSYYKLNYVGEIPESLREAFDELREKDEENPRKKYKSERKYIFQRIFKKENGIL